MDAMPDTSIYRGSPNKKCRRCKIRQPYDNFPYVGIDKTQHSAICQTCEPINTIAKKATTKALQRKYREKAYGLAPGEYERMLQDQQYTCAICKQPVQNERLSIDHNHQTGKVRGLLCLSWNWALGRFHDSVILLQNALDYLTKER
jgi:hypothetical protein